MRTLIMIAAMTFAAGAAWAEVPAVVAISSATGVCVKLTETSCYKAGSDLSYEIRHLPDGEHFAAGSVRAGSIRVDAWKLPAFDIENLKPKLWSPGDPQLYEITVKDSAGHDLGKTRFGFRTFEAKGDKLYLNGRPIFIRGEQINPPGREFPVETERDPEFIRGYLKLMKSGGVNLIRTEPQDWLDACDEVGMMLLAGAYGGIPGGSVETARTVFRDLLLRLASHPAVVMYVLTNEITWSKAPTAKQILTEVREELRALDPTRPVIGNAGFGHGQPGEIFDVHRYAGWYHGNSCDWYSDLTGYLAEARKANQPFTITECVGAYTSDAGDFLTMTKQMSTMTRWIGTTENPREAAKAYQAELVKQVVEITRRYRTEGNSIAGVMPFTYFLGWSSGAKKSDDIIIKPAFETLRTVFQPVLISPECWTRQLYSGDDLKTRLCLINDDESGRDIAASRAEVEIRSSDGSVVASGSVGMPAARYYTNSWADMAIKTPADLAKGYYDVRCKLVENGVEISHNSFGISIAPRAWVKAPAVTVTLFDPSGSTAKALTALGVTVTRIDSLREMPESGTLVLGEAALAEGLYPSKQSVLSFLDKGGRILCLRQERDKWNSDWLPASFPMEQRKPYRPYAYIQPRANASIYKDMTDRDLRYWNELGRTADGTPDICPVLSLLAPASVDELASARVWASSGALLSGAALLEVFHGKGSIVLSQFRAVERVDSDPMAAKLLANLVTYTTTDKSAGLLDLTQPIRWDHDAFRCGAFVSLLQGFLPHSKTYKHDGGSKGLQGADHRIDGFSMVGSYEFKNTGWLQPVPDPAADGWGVFYGTLSRRATSFALTLRNLGDTPAKIGLKLDGKPVGSPAVVPAGAEQTVEWPLDRAPGKVKVELRGDQRLVITGSCFR